MPICYSCGHEFGRRGEGGVCINCNEPITKEGKKIPKCPNCGKALEGKGFSECPHCKIGITLKRVRDGNLSKLMYVLTDTPAKVSNVKTRKNQIVEKIDGNTYKVTYRVSFTKLYCPNCRKEQLQIPRVLSGKVAHRGICSKCGTVTHHTFDI